MILKGSPAIHNDLIIGAHPIEEHDNILSGAHSIEEYDNILREVFKVLKRVTLNSIRKKYNAGYL